MSSALKISGQYIKDLSFENPSPAVFLSSGKSPDINVGVSVGYSRLKTKDENDTASFYEVMLHIEVKALIENNTAFLAEIKYCGIFRMENVASLTDDAIKRLVLIDAPQILFPFAREKIAWMTSSGGFPPLMLDIIDFEQMYDNQQQTAEDAVQN